VAVGGSGQRRQRRGEPQHGAWSVSLDFKSDAAKAWTQFTGKLACNQGVTREIAIVLDNVCSRPRRGPDVACNTGITSGTTSITVSATRRRKNLALVWRPAPCR